MRQDGPIDQLATNGVRFNHFRARVDRVRGVVDAVGTILNLEAAPYGRLMEETLRFKLLRNAFYVRSLQR